MTNKPIVLVIDDEPKKVALSKFGDVDLRTVSPSELTAEDIGAAHAILVDQVLEHWVPDPQPEFACLPKDGLALASIVRSYQRASGSPTPSAIALYSGALDKLVNEDNPQEHLVAIAFGIEWAFPKHSEDRLLDLDKQVSALAHAVQALPRNWDQNNADVLNAQLAGLLGLESQTWATRAFVDVERCRPPMHRLSEWTDGLAILRWMLHRILPYPCFLLGVPELALRLRVDPDWLRGALQQTSLRDAFRPAEYQGALAGFLHARWWWAAIEEVLTAGTDDKIGSFAAIHAFLGTVTGAPPRTLDIQQPVLTYDASGRFRALEPMRECVRIQPDDWPSYADEPWCRIDAAKTDASLRRLVVVGDLELVQPSDIEALPPRTP